MAHNSKPLCLPFYRDLRLLQGFGTERKSRENVTLKVIKNVNEIQFQIGEKVSRLTILEGIRFTPSVVLSGITPGSASRENIVSFPQMCGRSLLYLVALPFERIFA